MRLKDKVAVVTGGGRGIGRAIVERFAREGARVAICDADETALHETCAELRGQGLDVMPFVADVRIKTQVDEMADAVIRECGGIDIVVNNAGINIPAPFVDILEHEWDLLMSVNLKGTFLVSQRATVEMIRSRRGGSIIQMSSVNGLAAEANQAHYNATKGGVNLLAMTMALELACHGIRVNCLCPGFIETRLTKPLIDNPPRIADYLKSIPMGRVGQPEEIADSALYLASDESRYVTGHCLVVDGGQMIKLS